METASVSGLSLTNEQTDCLKRNAVTIKRPRSPTNVYSDDPYALDFRKKREKRENLKPDRFKTESTQIEDAEIW